MLDEASSRHSSFRQGSEIQLADGQTWVFPAPPEGSEWNFAPFGAEYRGLIRGILEAEDSSEIRLAELAFAIFLLGHNYRLSRADYESLLGSNPNSSDSRDWQVAFHQLAEDHLYSFLDNFPVFSQTGPLLDKPGKASRLSAWLRNHLPSRWFSFESRN